jgi:hypothetical protein
MKEKVIEATVQQDIQIDSVAVDNAKAKLFACIAALKFGASSGQFAADKCYAQLTAMESSINMLTAQTQRPNNYRFDLAT